MPACNGRTSSNRYYDRVGVYVIAYFGNVVTNADSSIVGKTTSVNAVSYLDDSIGANME